MSKPYFHHRAGTAVRPILGTDDLRQLLAESISYYMSQGYLQQAFGYVCVDEGVTSGAEGSSLGAYLLRQAYLKVGDPVERNLQHLSETELLGLHEVLFGVIAKPLDGRLHGYLNCGWHYSTFDAPEGRREFVERSNKYLHLIGPGYIMLKDGSIELILDEPAAEILTEANPVHNDPDVNTRISRAVARFKQGAATWDDREAAVRDLADVLEFLRPSAKKHLLRKDEADIFRLLNEFGIRHFNRDQKMDYDRPIFLKWLFYHLLAAIHACIELDLRAD